MAPPGRSCAGIDANALERDEKKCEHFFAASRSKLLESITFMILDQFDPKSS